jgi:peptidoglycan hydrolase CwlO-like protein
MDDIFNWLQSILGAEILLSILSGFLALTTALASDYLRPLLGKIIVGKQRKKTETYSEKLIKLTSSLTKASAEVDDLLVELSKVASERESAVNKLEADLARLEGDEKQIQQRIKDLKNIPVPVAEHFATIIRQGEKRSASRDYLLFGLGVVVSTVIAILLHLAGLG